MDVTLSVWSGWLLLFRFTLCTRAAHFVHLINSLKWRKMDRVTEIEHKINYNVYCVCVRVIVCHFIYLKFRKINTQNAAQELLKNFVL